MSESEINGALTDVAADIIVDALAADQETFDTAMGAATGDEKLAAAQQLARQAVAARAAPATISILQMPNRVMQIIAAVWRIVCHSEVSLDLDRMLGDDFKVMYADDVATATRWLMLAGLLPNDSTPA
jgi:hypothetical protein